jgi:hypothetical protein
MIRLSCPDKFCLPLVHGYAWIGARAYRVQFLFDIMESEGPLGREVDVRRSMWEGGICTVVLQILICGFHQNMPSLLHPQPKAFIQKTKEIITEGKFVKMFS